MNAFYAAKWFLSGPFSYIISFPKGKSQKPCHCLDYAAATAAAKLLQSCPTLCNPRDGNPSSSTVPGILQARTLEWVAISFSNAWKWKVKVKSLSRVRLLATPCTATIPQILKVQMSIHLPGKTFMSQNCSQVPQGWSGNLSEGLSPVQCLEILRLKFFPLSGFSHSVVFGSLQ